MNGATKHDVSENAAIAYYSVRSLDNILSKPLNQLKLHGKWPWQHQIALMPVLEMLCPKTQIHYIVSLKALQPTC